MKKFSFSVLLAATCMYAQAQKTPSKSKVRYDTIIVKRVTKPAVKQVKKTEAPPVEKQPIVLPVPEYINQPYYYDTEGNRLIKLENATAQMNVKKKAFGLQGAKQSLSMEGTSCKIRFTAKKDIVFFIKTSGDVIDITSYIKLYQFIPAEQRREVTINNKVGMLSDKEEGKGKLINFSVKMIAKDNYMIQLPEQLQAGEYGFVWLKNIELIEFTVFGFGIDWKSSD